MPDYNNLNEFKIQNETYKIRLISSSQIISGVICHAYEFTDDKEKDLGIIEIQPGSKTPAQLILKGSKTIEGYLSGSGYLKIKRENGNLETHEAVSNFQQILYKGDTMQRMAGSNSNLVVYEICYPPFQDGRFQNLDLDL